MSDKEIVRCEQGLVQQPITGDLAPDLGPAGLVSSGFSDPRPFFGPLAVRVFQLFHDGGLAAQKVADYEIIGNGTRPIKYFVGICVGAGELGFRLVSLINIHVFQYRDSAPPTPPRSGPDTSVTSAGEGNHQRMGQVASCNARLCAHGAHGDGGGGSAVFNAELWINLFKMLVHGSRAHFKNLADIAV